MTSEAELKEAVEELHAAATSVGALVLPTLPGVRDTPEIVRLKRPDLLKLVNHLAPKIVYLEEIRFDAVVQLVNLLDVDDDELIESPEVKAAAKPWARHNGELCE